ncbi:phosphotransferase enzyme family protein [Deinococcus pimensis]|uniref:phosphotransferase enzyme family protein n=1 Tax=Deinococcus pimensis TaxID=309888 RepID=UPI0004870587|nr:phosphotransferase [Deinococcus pimensis]
MTLADPSLPPDSVVREVLSRFGVAGARTTLLRRGDNTVYRVDLPDGGKRALRLHTAARHARSRLEAELVWLEYLSARLSGRVPGATRAETGELVVDVALLPSGKATLCSLLTWVEGEPLAEDVEFTREQAAWAGELLGRVHTLSGHFDPGGPLDRPTYDAAYFALCGRELRASLPPEGWPPERSDVLLENLEIIGALLGDWTSLPGGYGLVHADAHPGNFVTQGGTLGLLDWDRCGFGPFLLDVAGVTLALDEAERDAFLTSYSRVRPLPEGSREAVRALRLLAATENLAFLARREHERPFVLGALLVLEDLAATWRRELPDVRTDGLGGR